MAWEIASDTAPKHVEPWIASTKQENKQIIFELEKIQHKVCYDFLFVCFLQVGKRNQMQQNYLILSQLGTKHLQNVCTPVLPTYPAIFFY